MCCLVPGTLMGVSGDAALDGVLGIVPTGENTADALHGVPGAAPSTAPAGGLNGVVVPVEPNGVDCPQGAPTAGGPSGVPRPLAPVEPSGVPTAGGLNGVPDGLSKNR